MPLTDEALAEAGTQLADVLMQRELTIATAEICTATIDCQCIKV